MTPLTQESVGLGMRVSRSDPEGLAESQMEQCSKTRADLRKQLNQRSSTVVQSAAEGLTRLLLTMK